MLWILLASVLATATDGAAPDDLTAALAREAAGDTAAALEGLEKVMRAQPSWAVPRLEAARLLLKLGEDLGRAEAHVEAALALSPENPRGHYLRGQLWEERGQPLRAAQEYERALQYRPSYEEARFRLASLWRAQGDMMKAELHYRLLSRARPGWVQVRLQLAQVLEAQHRVVDAEEELLALKEGQPGNPLVKRQLADFYERTGRPELAAKVRARLEPAVPERRLRPLPPSRR